MYQFPLFYSFSYERQRKHATTILWDIPFKIDVSANDFVRNVYFDSPANFDQWFISIANQKTKLDKYQSDFQSPSFVYIKSRQAKLKKKISPVSISSVYKSKQTDVHLFFKFFYISKYKTRRTSAD